MSKLVNELVKEGRNISSVLTLYIPSEIRLHFTLNWHKYATYL
jgi:hypothetical protein